jgi:hypothetical protein
VVPPPPPPVPPPATTGTIPGPAARATDDEPDDGEPGTGPTADAGTEPDTTDTTAGDTGTGTDTDTDTDSDTDTDTDGDGDGDGDGERPTVDAVRCPDGHPNPPGSGTCRTCDRAITDDAVESIERPSLGALQIKDGERIELERPVLIGRRPPESATIGDEEATVVTIAGSDALSRSHAEVRLDGWTVQVVDLGSVNHTYVTAPGADPVRLRPDEPFAIEPGAIVNLGAAVEITYEA